MVGMLLMWLSLMGSRGASIYINITGNADDIVNSPVIAFLAYMAIIGGVLHVTAPGITNPNDWSKNKTALKIGIAASIPLAILILILQNYVQH